tara:strand:- start:177 stop:800 length:624 start_codon:yes stop_codon:yes gene_type:complete
MKKKNIVFFGGSFDPIHNGHVHMVNQLKLHFDLDELIFIPTYKNYMKDEPLFSAQDRFNSVNDLIKKLPKSKCDQQFFVSDYEIKQQVETYTIDTIMHFEKKYKNERFILLIGSDNFFEFHRWKDYEKILKTVSICVIRRDDLSIATYHDYIFEKLHQKVLSSIMIIDKPPVKISSTELRNKIKNKEDISEFVPQEVIESLGLNDKK